MRVNKLRSVVIAAVFAALGAVLTPAPAVSADDADGWVNLFNGKDLEGWVQRGGKAKYSVEDGQIVGRAVPNTANSFLCTTKDYGDFVLELEFKVDADLNSGVQVRSHCFDRPTKFEAGGKERTIPAGRVHGYQVEIDPDVKRGRLWTGGIYEEGRRGWLQDLKNNEPARKAFKPGEWNKLRVECRGDHIRTWLNGVPAADLRTPPRTPASSRCRSTASARRPSRWRCASATCASRS